MPRPRKSLLSEIVQVSAKFPWWVSALLALASYAALHAIASSIEIKPVTDMHGFAHAAGKQIVKTFAAIFQYVVAAVFLIASVVSLFARRKREGAYAKVATTNEYLENMSWQDFELLVSEFFRQRGFSVKELGGSGPDGGIDLSISAGSDRYVVQCKKWKARRVDVTTVRELYGVMAATGAAGAFVVTSGDFTREARRFAEGREIELISADHLLKQIGKGQIGDRTTAGSKAPHSAPACPRCGASMLIRKTRNGPQVGAEFWGCSAFPKCRGTRPAEVVQ